MITYNVDGIKMPVFPKRKVSHWIKQVAEIKGKRVGTIAYIFCSDDKILEINKQYLNHDYYTDIITFDYTEGNEISGDIFVSLDTVKSNSQKFNTQYEEELCRVLIHGILHLCGFDDETPEEKALMREKEDAALALR